MHDLNTLRHNKPNAISEIVHETIRFNRNITVDHNKIFWKRWFCNGIRYVRNMLDSVGNFMSQDELNKYHINYNFIDLQRISLVGWLFNAV